MMTMRGATLANRLPDGIIALGRLAAIFERVSGWEFGKSLA